MIGMSTKDEAGPLVGWSLDTGFRKRTLDELVDFPCVFMFKAVGQAGADFVSGMLARVAAVLGRAVTDDEHTVRSSSKGNYESVTLNLYVSSGDEVRDVYRAISADDRVKFLL